jgi:DNA processing protein
MTAPSGSPSAPRAALPDEAYLAALCDLPEMWPRRLAALSSAVAAPVLWQGLATSDAQVIQICIGVLGAGFDTVGDLDGAASVRGVRRRDAVPLVRQWCTRAADLDVEARWRQYREAGVGVCGAASASYPACFVDDPAPPVVLFHRGPLDRCAGARVAIVGTRTCTRYGREVADELGEALSVAGVAVVSGLALGIDAAAHEGALRGPTPPVAVVGSGLDRPYPAANRGLWGRVADHGCVLSESPLGEPPRAWRFPQRNRLIAALADVVVVVESHVRGGSLITADEAQRRGRTVLAVPGAVRSAASAGTNALLADGCAPVCGPEDVLVALGLSPGARRPARERRPPPDPAGRAVLDALGWQPASLDQLTARCPLGLAALVGCLDTLERTGWIARRGAWYERVARDRVR